MIHTTTSPIEMVLTIIALSFWFLFPFAMFLSVSHVDKNTDQIIRLEEHRHAPEEEFVPEKKIPVYRPEPFDWHHPLLHFQRWLQHD